MLNNPPLTANNDFQYAVIQAPPDTDSKYSGGGLYAQQPVKNKWYEILDIGVESRTGSNQVTYASPLTAGAIQRIKTDSPPDFWLIEITVGAANTQLQIWTDGDPVGYPVRLGNGGNCCLPSRGRPYLTLRAVTGAVVGTVMALSGYSPGEVFMFGGNQA